MAKMNEINVVKHRRLIFLAIQKTMSRKPMAGKQICPKSGILDAY